MDRNFFTGVKIEEIKLSTGARIGLPVRYYDWSVIMAHFPVPAARVRELLPSDRLKPALLLPGTAALSMVAMEYRQIADVAPYNEFGIMVPCLHAPTINLPGLPLLFPHWFKRFGLYIHHLPVTTQAAYDFGDEIWAIQRSSPTSASRMQVGVRHSPRKAKMMPRRQEEIKMNDYDPVTMDPPGLDTEHPLTTSSPGR